MQRGRSAVVRATPAASLAGAAAVLARHGIRRQVTGLGFFAVALFGGAGAFVQGVTGFGGALVVAPVLFSVMPPAQAVVVMAAIGAAQSAVMGLHGRRAVLGHELPVLLVFALPGMVVGALTLSVASPAALRLGVGLSVVAATVMLSFRPRVALPRGSGGVVGFLAGALTTTVTVNGPPLVLYLTARGATPNQLRSTLAVAFLAIDLAVAVPLALTGTLAAPPAAAVAALAVAFPLGLVAGIRVAPRLSTRAYTNAVFVLLLAMGLATTVAGAVEVVRAT